MKVLSYNVYGVRKLTKKIPSFKHRRKNLKRILNTILTEEKIDVICMQEVNLFNEGFIIFILDRLGYKVLKRFPMRAGLNVQFNLIAISKHGLKFKKLFSLPHSADKKYKSFWRQKPSYGMSEYRTTFFVEVEDETRSYIIGNTHTDHISEEGRKKGIEKSLTYLDRHKAEVKLLTGDMNTSRESDLISNILKNNPNYELVTKTTRDILSFHHYGLNKEKDLDFAFINKGIPSSYHIIAETSLINEGSDHRPVIIEIGDNNENRNCSRP